MSTAQQTRTFADVFSNRRTRNAGKSLAKLETQIAELEARVDHALREGVEVDSAQPAKPAKLKETTIWGVPFSHLTLVGTLRHIDRLIAWGEPGYFITANLNYNMLTDRHPELRDVNENASFIVCDGMPAVWYSRWINRPLPERVAGSELIYALNKWSASKGHRVFFLGGGVGVAQSAADKLVARYPRLQVVGVESPPFRPLTDKKETELVNRVRDARPDIVYIAFGQPKGEIWMAKNHAKLGAPGLRADWGIIRLRGRRYPACSHLGPTTGYGVVFSASPGAEAALSSLSGQRDIPYPRVAARSISEKVAVATGRGLTHAQRIRSRPTRSQLDTKSHGPSELQLLINSDLPSEKDFGSWLGGHGGTPTHGHNNIYGRTYINSVHGVVKPCFGNKSVEFWVSSRHPVMKACGGMSIEESRVDAT